MNVRVRDYHLDGYGHAGNARYLEFPEEARWAFFKQRGLLSALKGIMFVVACVDICYRCPAVEGDELRLEDRLKKVTPRHIVLTQTIILPNDKNAVEAEVTAIAANAASGRSIGILVSPSTASKTITAE